AGKPEQPPLIAGSQYQFLGSFRRQKQASSSPQTGVIPAIFSHPIIRLIRPPITSAAAIASKPYALGLGTGARYKCKASGGLTPRPTSGLIATQLSNTVNAN